MQRDKVRMKSLKMSEKMMWNLVQTSLIILSNFSYKSLDNIERSSRTQASKTLPKVHEVASEEERCGGDCV